MIGHRDSNFARMKGIYKKEKEKEIKYKYVYVALTSEGQSEGIVAEFASRIDLRHSVRAASRRRFSHLSSARSFSSIKQASMAATSREEGREAGGEGEGEGLECFLCFSMAVQAISATSMAASTT